MWRTQLKVEDSVSRHVVAGSLADVFLHSLSDIFDFRGDIVDHVVLLEGRKLLIELQELNICFEFIKLHSVD